LAGIPEPPQLYPEHLVADRDRGNADREYARLVGTNTAFLLSALSRPARVEDRYGFAGGGCYCCGGRALGGVIQ